MTIIVASYLTGETPITSNEYRVLPVECKNDVSYWAGLNEAWCSTEPLINVERDMVYSDERAAELLECPHAACMYPYKVFPTMLQRYIYCATTDGPGDLTDPERFGPDALRWVEGPEDTWAAWASIGFCKIAPEARTKPLDRMFWMWLEHCVNRNICAAGFNWHLHWPEAVHLHDYETTPDHLW